MLLCIKKVLPMNAKQLQTKFEAYLLTEKCVSHNTFHSYKKDIDQFMQFLTKKKLRYWYNP
jgi:site-specific recombinase XerD